VSGQGISQVIVYAVALIVLAYPLGGYMARVYDRESFLAGRLGWLRTIERGFYRLIDTDGSKEQNWKSYGKTALSSARCSRRSCTRSSACSPTCS
jgi:potassium-transporting ATPase potassium-binding subunit